MIILGLETSKFDKKQNLLLLAHIMHIAHFFNLYGADMRLISCRWVTILSYQRKQESSAFRQLSSAVYLAEVSRYLKKLDPMLDKARYRLAW